MLSITGMNKFYYIKNFTDMRCKYNRILAVIRKFMIMVGCDGLLGRI